MCLQRLCLLVAPVVLFVIIGLAAGDVARHAEASHAGGMDLIAVDMDPSKLPPNTATSLGTYHFCLYMSGGESAEIDITASGIPASNPMTGFSYTLTYPMGFEITSADPDFLLFSEPGSVPPAGGQPLPDTDGTWTSTVVDSGPPSAAETGSGVLERLVIHASPAITAGVYSLVLTDATHTDTTGTPQVPDEVYNSFIVVGTPCIGGPDGDNDSVPNQDDNCPNTPNTDQEDADLDWVGDACDFDDDNDAVCDVGGPEAEGTPGVPAGGCNSGLLGLDNCIVTPNPGQEDPDTDAVGTACDNCPATPNADQDDADTDTTGDACDSGDSDGDFLADQTEYFCGAPRDDAGSIPERVDGGFSGVDDDGDTLVDEPLAAAAAAFDCDGDGFTGADEAHLFGDTNVRDQDPCGTDGWPLEIDDGSPPDSANRVNIRDLQTFILPVRRLGTSPGDGDFDVRWDIVPGPGGPFASHINIADLSKMAFDLPPMLGGATRAFGGPVCPWPP